ncbi:MAG: beta-ketoacyl synthase chain length factor [Pseudomonadota bacterium]|nr:beta-ketoacyl synthase chain length factor [Pseudomonadota bacterium]
MRAVIGGAHSWSIGGADVALAAQPELPAGLSFHLAPEPPRPEAVAAGTWRRMSRVARIAAVCAAPILERRADRDELALFWGTGIGEFSSTAGFLRTLFTKGPLGASPLLFQNAVHNAPAGHLSIAFGLRGPSETICAGPQTSIRVLERALAWVTLYDRPALVLVADDLGPDVQQGYTFAEASAPMGEGGAALLLLPDGDGPELTWADAPPAEGDWQRRHAYPLEPPCSNSPGPSHDARLGLFPAVDLVALAACARTGGTVAWAAPAGGRERSVRLGVRA